MISKTNTEVSQLITGKRNITPDWAVRIAAAFGTSEGVRLWLQKMYDTYKLYKSWKADTIREAIQTKVQELALA